MFLGLAFLVNAHDLTQNPYVVYLPVPIVYIFYSSSVVPLFDFYLWSHITPYIISGIERPCFVYVSIFYITFCTEWVLYLSRYSMIWVQMLLVNGIYPLLNRKSRRLVHLEYNIIIYDYRQSPVKYRAD